MSFQLFTGASPSKPSEISYEFFFFSLQETTSLPVQQSSGLVNVNTEPKEVASNVQRDQSAPVHQEQIPVELLETLADLPSLPTDTPFISYHVTKSPGSIKTPRLGCSWHLYFDF